MILPRRVVRLPNAVPCLAAVLALLSLLSADQRFAIRLCT